MSEIASRLAEFREARGFSAARLAAAVGVTRQTVYAMESGAFVPNTAVALRLARVLDVRVEDLFTLPEAEPDDESPPQDAVLLDGSEPLDAGQPVQLCRVGKRLMASPPSPDSWCIPAADAVAAAPTGPKGRTKVRALHCDVPAPDRILLAGCDPAISVLARHVRAAGVELVLAHRNSSQSLELLRARAVHVAGTHLCDEATGESNVPHVRRLFPKKSVALISFALWEEGILTAPGNPRGIRGVEDFARPELCIVNRERGAGSRALLDSHLAKLGIPAASVRGYDDTAAGHLAAAAQVRSGKADCCLATRAAARLHGLFFIPLTGERYDLAIHRDHLQLPAIVTLVETLGRAAFRRELEALGGYDTKGAGDRLL